MINCNSDQAIFQCHELKELFTKLLLIVYSIFDHSGFYCYSYFESTDITKHCLLYFNIVTKYLTDHPRVMLVQTMVIVIKLISLFKKGLEKISSKTRCEEAIIYVSHGNYLSM